MEDVLTKHRKEINKFCKTNQVAKLLLYGSYSKNTYTNKSDIDLLVEFEKGSKVGLLDMARMERELSELLDIKVDLRTPDELSKHFRNTVVKEAEVKYESGR